MLYKKQVLSTSIVTVKSDSPTFQAVTPKVINVTTWTTPVAINWYQNRFLYTRTRLSEWYYNRLGGNVVRIGPTTLMKYRTTIQEARSLQFVNAHPSIPSPQFYRVVLKSNGGLCLFMEYITAPELEKIWENLNPSQRSIVLEQLRVIIRAMRHLPNPMDDLIQACDESPILDDPFVIEPFKGTVAAFHDMQGVTYIRENLRSKFSKAVCSSIDTCAERAMAKSYQIKFTHGDLAPRNILINPKTLKIAALVDWEHAGWWPEYWEYTRTYFCNQGWAEWWQLFQEAIVECHYEDELIMEQSLSDTFTRFL